MFLTKRGQTDQTPFQSINQNSQYLGVGRNVRFRETNHFGEPRLFAINPDQPVPDVGRPNFGFARESAGTRA